MRPDICWDANANAPHFSVEHLTRVMQHAPLTLFAFNSDGIITITAGAVLSILDRDPGDLVGESVFALSHHAPDNVSHFRRALSGESFTVPWSSRGRTFDVHYDPVIEAGEVVEVIAVCTDVTDRADVEARLRAAENELRTSEARFRTSFEDAAIGMSLVALDGGWLRVNRSLCAMLGYSEEELLKLRFQDITHPDDVEPDLRLVRQLVAGDIASYHLEKRYLHRDGHIVWVLLSVSLVRDSEGTPLYFVSQIQNISRRKQVEEELRQEHDRLQVLMDNLPDSIYFKDADSRFIQINQALARLFGLEDPSEAIDRTDFDFFTVAHAQPALDDERRILQSGQPVIGKVEQESLPNGTTRWVLTTKMPMFDTDGRTIGTFGISRDISAMKQAEAALTHQALHDSLTGLPNRNLLRDRLEEALTTARSESTNLSLFFLDVNRFKSVNDTFGHHSGDSVLQMLAHRLQTIVGRRGTAARLGGDELAVLLLNADEFVARTVADEILASLSEPFSINGEQFDVGASVGIALYPDHGTDPSILMRRADTAMYMAKRGGDGYVFYSPQFDLKSPIRGALTRELRTAIETDQLYLAYQPQIRLHDHALEGVEALVRWQHPTRGSLSPDSFIPAAEESGLIRPLTTWVLNAALCKSAEWSRQGIHMRMCVNISARSLHDSALVENVRTALKFWSVSPHNLVLEITESAIIVDPERALDTITRLHDLGIRISIDDFGTGYSSLSYLNRLPVDEVKIDRSFVSEMTTKTDSAVIVRSVIDLARNLGIGVVAEGVEDAMILESLAREGCELAQGYYISRPISAEMFSGWLAGWMSSQVA